MIYPIDFKMTGIVPASEVAQIIGWPEPLAYQRHNILLKKKTMPRYNKACLYPGLSGQ